MTILWFYIIISWSGDAIVRHGFIDEASCSKHRQGMYRTISGTVRTVTPCIGLPMEE